jgi:hypothetical protein
MEAYGQEFAIGTWKCDSSNKKIPQALKSLYRSPGHKKNQCKNYVLQW